MALINMGVADGSTLGDPTTGNYFLFFDSNNSDLLTRRNSDGEDIVYGVGDGIDALGWITITDTTYTEGSPFEMLGNTDTALTFNVDSYIDTAAPNGYDVDDYFDDSIGRILSPTLNAAYMFRLTFTCKPDNNSRIINTIFSIGTGVGSQIVIDKRSAELRTSGVGSFISISTLIYSGSTFLTNGMQIILRATTECDVYDINMMISRIN